jgi:uncharacterized protein (DUF305 family)
MSRIPALLLATSLTAAGALVAVAVAQTDHAAMGHAMPVGDQGPSSMAFAQANDAMHTAMNITYTGDADIDFARGMIAHHEGAVAMAQVVLDFGSDPEIRALAQAIIAAQQPEIDFMNDWLRRQGE